MFVWRIPKLEALEQVFDDLEGLIKGDVELAGEAAAAAAAVAGVVWGVRALMMRGANEATKTEDP